MPKVKLTPIKQKTKKEEIKELIQNPDDPLAKYPLRAFGYSNEVGAAVSAMPVWGKAAEAALWVPALMYLGADIYDKYRRGKEGDYTKASSTAAVQQATFQALASVILPTAAVKMGQNIAGYTTKFDGSGLTATAKEEMYDKLLNEFDNYNFAKGDIQEADGTIIKGFDRVKKRIIEEKLIPELKTTRTDLETESWFAKVVRFFGHSNRPISSAKANEADVISFMEKQAKKIFDKQTIFETSTREQIEEMDNPELIKLYDKASKNAEKRAQKLIQSSPDYIMKKILNSGEAEHKDLIHDIAKTYDTVEKRRLLVRQADQSGNVIKQMMQNPAHKATIEKLAKRLEISRTALRGYIKGKSMKLGLLKTTGGFIALGLLAVPIDHFVHKYIIKKFVEPGLEGVESLKEKLSFKAQKEPVAGPKLNR